MRQELSASYAWLYRWGLSGLLTLTALATLWFFADMGTDQPPQTGKVIIGVLLAAMQVVLARTFDRAKRVWLEGSKLIVYDFNQTAEIDLGNIECVEVMPFFWPHRVKVLFRQPTVFGDWVVFFPRLCVSVRHPVIETLKSAVAS